MRSHRSRWWARLLAVPTTGLLLLASVLLASPATAHASLLSTDPADGDVLDSSPAAVTLTFSEPVRLTDGIELLSGEGTPVAAEVTGRDAVVTITPDAPLADGTYIVGWRVISADTHPVAGGFSFSVGAPSATSIEIPTAKAPRDVDLLRKAAEAARYGGVLVASGLIGFGLLVAAPARRDSRRARRRIDRGAAWAAAAAALAALALAPLTVLWQGGSGLSSFGSAVGDAATWRSDTALAAAVLIGALLAALALRRRLPAVALAAAAAACGSLALVGHTRTFGPAALVVTADLLHVTVAALWAGGLTGLTLLFSVGRDVRPLHLQHAIRRFSALALISVAVLALSGAVLWWRIPATVRDLPDSSYGVHLLVKVVLVGILVMIASVNLRHLRTERTADTRLLRRTVGTELAVIALVVAATAGLVTQVPRTASASPVTPEAPTLTFDLGDGIDATLTLTPGGVGTNSAHLRVRDAGGDPVDALEPPQVSVGIVEYDLGPFKHELTPVGPGEFEGIVDLPIEGTWHVEVAVRTSTYERPSGEADLEVAP
ncbi:MAG: copper resistance protein CopC [Aeromicrobium sp.]|uniref:copper resistance CopC/CopD family protein n=1 Tax=Aeromicrobium sp. TaxID=1871063 RepID=UPI0039E2A437